MRNKRQNSKFLQKCSYSCWHEALAVLEFNKEREKERHGKYIRRVSRKLKLNFLSRKVSRIKVQDFPYSLASTMRRVTYWEIARRECK